MYLWFTYEIPLPSALKDQLFSYWPVPVLQKMPSITFSSSLCHPSMLHCLTVELYFIFSIWCHDVIKVLGIANINNCPRANRSTESGTCETVNTFMKPKMQWDIRHIYLGFVYSPSRISQSWWWLYSSPESVQKLGSCLQ